MIFLTSPGKTYSVNSISGCTISAGGTTLVTIPANVQTTFIAPEEEVLVSDNNAIIVEVTGVGAGGSGGSGEGGSGGVTAEEIQAVVPIAWDVDKKNTLFGVETRSDIEGTAVGYKAQASGTGNVAIGAYAKTGTNYNVSIGRNPTASGVGTIAIGSYATVKNTKIPLLNSAIAIGTGTLSDQANAITLGAQYNENVNGENVINYCQTQGTGSITIGAGANTLNNGDTESSNSVTIGCKASNSGADSVVIGAQASGASAGSIVIGAGAKFGVVKTSKILAIGLNATTDSLVVGNKSYSGVFSVAVGNDAKCGNYSIAIGDYCNVGAMGTAVGQGVINTARRGSAFGYGAIASDAGVVVFSSTTDNGDKTQLYFSGANTPLANTYANGEGIMGYVTSDKDGNPIASGFKRLSALFDEGTMTQPATLDENGEWVQPKVFRPSDVDLPVEEPTEPEEYTPLPVYPIVEPEIEEIPSES